MKGLVWLLTITVSCLMWMAIAVAITGCGTWSVQFGMSEYNQSAESRGFRPENEKK